MTDLQVRYQTLQETIRANRMAEQQRGSEIAIKQRDVDSNVALRTAQENKAYAEIDRVAHEIQNIDANTELTKQQKDAKKAETFNSWLKFATGVLDPFGITQSLAQGIGSGLGKAAGALIMAG